MPTPTAATPRCPLSTSQRLSPLEEAHKYIEPGVRAYKLGRQRWSYNQCEILLVPEGSEKPSELTVVESWQTSQIEGSHEACDSQVSYKMRLSNNVEVHVVIFVVHTQPCGQEPATSTEAQQYLWTCVSRGECNRGCEGPILRPLKRTGLVTSKGHASEGTSTRNGTAKRQVKDARYVHLSIDEACTHIGVKSFRLIAGVYDRPGHQLLGTACSLPIRVVSNNDAPGGAAHITLSASIRRDWLGWQGCSPSNQLPRVSAASSPGTAKGGDASAAQLDKGFAWGSSGMQESGELANPQTPAARRPLALSQQADQLQARVAALPAMDFRPFKIRCQVPTAMDLPDHLAECRHAGAAQQTDSEISHIQHTQNAADLRRYGVPDMAPEELSLEGHQLVQDLSSSCAPAVPALANGAATLPHQDVHEQPVAFHTPSASPAAAGLPSYDPYYPEDQLLGLAAHHSSQQNAGCSQHGNGARLQAHADAALNAGFALHGMQQPQQQQNPPRDVFRSSMASQAMLGLMNETPSDSSLSRASRSCRNSPEGQQQQSHSAPGVQLSASQSELDPLRCGFDSSPAMGGLNGDPGNRQKLKRKLSSSDLDFANRLEIASIQRELIFTQHELQVLRMQYLELHRVCRGCMLDFNSAAPPNDMTAQPGSWPSMSTPSRSRQALLTQDYDLLQVPRGQWFTPQSGSPE